MKLATNGNSRPRAAITEPGPAHSLEAERGVLAAAIFDSANVDTASEFIGPNDFYRDSHGQIFKALLELHERRANTDPISLTEELRRMGVYERIGGDEAIDDLMATIRAMPHFASAAHHAGIVLDKAITRRLVQLGDDLERHAHDGLLSAEAMLTLATERLAEFSSRISFDSHTATVPDLALEAVDRIHRRQGGEILGLPTGMADVDALFNGFNPGWFYIVAGRPSMGKTAWAIQVADHVAASGSGVLFFSLEMTRTEIGERLVIMQSEVGSERVCAGAKWLTTKDMAAIGRGYEVLKTRKNFAVDDSAVITVAQINAMVRRERARRDLGLVVIDYVQLVSPSESGSRQDNRQEQVAKISRGIKALAKENQVAVLVCAQLSRETESRENHRPRMADLRESGQLEQDAHVVLALHRPEYYNPNDSPGLAELLVLKNRNGQTGIVPLVFRKNLMMFGDHSPLPAGAF